MKETDNCSNRPRWGLLTLMAALCLPLALWGEADPAPVSAVPLMEQELEELVRCVTDRHHFPNVVREKAIKRLASANISKDQQDQVIGALLEVVWERDLREESEKALLEKFGKAAVPHLVAAMTEKTRGVAIRCSSARLLGRLTGIPDHESQPILDALVLGMEDIQPPVRLAASQALVRRGRSGILALIQVIETGEPLAVVSAANALSVLVQEELPEPFQPLIVAAEGPLLQRIESTDPELRYAALISLNQLLKKMASTDPTASIRRVKVLKAAMEDPQPHIQRYAAGVLDDFRMQCSLDWLTGEALTSEHASVRAYAGESLLKLRALSALELLGHAAEIETDEPTKKILRRSHTYLDLADKRNSGNRRLQAGVIVVAILAILALLVPFGREWWLKRVEDRELRLRANREFISQMFGLGQLNENTHGYAAILAELRSLDLRENSTQRQRLTRLVEHTLFQLGVSDGDCKSEFPYKTDFIQLLLLKVAHATSDDHQVFSSTPLFTLEVPGQGHLTLTQADFQEVNVNRKSGLSVTLLGEGLNHKLDNARKSIGFLADRWKLFVPEIQQSPADLRIAFLTTIVTGDEPHERLNHVITEISNKFTFLATLKISRMPALEKILFLIACGKQDISLSAFEDFVQQVALKPLRMGTMDSLSRILKPSQEAEEEMYRIYADRITGLLSEFSTRNEVCEELMNKGKDHVVSQVFDQMGQVRVHDRESIGELMKTAAIGKVMRQESDSNRLRRIEIENEVTMENIRLIRRLLELSRLDEPGREAFRYELEIQITPEDRSTFDIGGLPAKRLRELLNRSIDAVSSQFDNLSVEEQVPSV